MDVFPHVAGHHFRAYTRTWFQVHHFDLRILTDYDTRQSQSGLLTLLHVIHTFKTLRQGFESVNDMKYWSERGPVDHDRFCILDSQLSTKLNVSHVVGDELRRLLWSWEGDRRVDKPYLCL